MASCSPYVCELPEHEACLETTRNRVVIRLLMGDPYVGFVDSGIGVMPNGNGAFPESLYDWCWAYREGAVSFTGCILTEGLSGTARKRQTRSCRAEDILTYDYELTVIDYGFDPCNLSYIFYNTLTLPGPKIWALLYSDDTLELLPGTVSAQTSMVVPESVDDPTYQETIIRWTQRDITIPIPMHGLHTFLNSLVLDAIHIAGQTYAMGPCERALYVDLSTDPSTVTLFPHSRSAVLDFYNYTGGDQPLTLNSPLGQPFVGGGNTRTFSNASQVRAIYNPELGTWYAYPICCSVTEPVILRVADVRAALVTPTNNLGTFYSRAGDSAIATLVLDISSLATASPALEMYGPNYMLRLIGAQSSKILRVEVNIDQSTVSGTYSLQMPTTPIEIGWILTSLTEYVRSDTFVTYRGYPTHASPYFEKIIYRFYNRTNITLRFLNSRLSENGDPAIDYTRTPAGPFVSSAGVYLDSATPTVNNFNGGTVGIDRPDTTTTQGNLAIGRLVHPTLEPNDWIEFEYNPYRNVWEEMSSINYLNV